MGEQKPERAADITLVGFEQVFGMSPEAWVAKVADGIQEEENCSRKEAEAEAWQLLRRQWQGPPAAFDESALDLFFEQWSGLRDPAWGTCVPEAGASAEKIKAWIALFVEDPERERYDKISRAEAESTARRMLAQQWKESLPFDPDTPASIEDWRSYAVEEVERSEGLPRTDAERFVRKKLEAMLTTYRKALKSLADCRCDYGSGLRNACSY